MFSISDRVRPEVDDLSEPIFFSISAGSSRSMACSMMAVMYGKWNKERTEEHEEQESRDKREIEYDLRGTRATMVCYRGPVSQGDNKV